MRRRFQELLTKLTEGFPEAPVDGASHIIHKLSAQKEHFEWFSALTEDANLLVRTLADVYIGLLPPDSPLSADLQALRQQVKSDKWFT